MTTIIRSVVALLVTSWATLAFGAEPTSAQGSNTPQPAKLEIGGRTIASFRATIFSYRPVDRAEAARLRLLTAYVVGSGDAHWGHGPSRLGHPSAAAYCQQWLFRLPSSVEGHRDGRRDVPGIQQLVSRLL